MFCHICGTQIPEDAGFCHKCGTKVVYEDSADAKQGACDFGYKISLMKDNVNRKRAKIVFLIMAVVIMLILIRSGVLRDTFEMLEDINMEMEAQISGATIVPYMQSGDYVFSSDSAAGTADNLSESSFAWVEEAHMVIEDDFIETRYIVGAIKNISNTTFTSASVQFILYDSAGNQLDTTSDYILNF